MEMVDDNGVKWISAREYAGKHGVTKAWVIKLCHQGRIENAYKAGSVWMMPADEPMPEKLARGPIPRLDSSRALKAVAVAQNRAKREALKAMPKVEVDPSKLEGRDRWLWMIKQDGRSKIEGRWVWDMNEDLTAGDVITAAWMPGETEEQWRTRKIEFDDWIQNGMNVETKPADFAEYERIQEERWQKK